jgi:hypothetical protein
MANHTDNDMPEQLLSMDSTGDDRMKSENKFGMLTLNIIKESSSANESTNENNEMSPTFSIRKIYKNLLIISLAFVLMFTAYNGMVTLQSSLNKKNDVGVNSLTITYAFLIVKSIDNASIILENAHNLSLARLL